MDTGLHKKIYDILVQLPELSEDNVFYLKSDVNPKIFPRYVVSTVSDVASFDTEDNFFEVLFQISCFDNFKSSKVENLREKANLITGYMRIEYLKNMEGYSVSRCRLQNRREVELDNIFQIDLTFRANLKKDALSIELPAIIGAEEITEAPLIDILADSDIFPIVRGGVLRKTLWSVIKNYILTLVRPYKVYTALLTQTGTNAPVATILENTIGDIIWLRNQAGIYNANIGSFPYAKIFCNYFGGGDFGNNRALAQDITMYEMNGAGPYAVFRVFQSNTYINIYTLQYGGGESSDNMLENFPIEIRVYP